MIVPRDVQTNGINLDIIEQISGIIILDYGGPPTTLKFPES